MKLKKQEGGFLDMLLGTLVTLILGNILTGKTVLRVIKGVVRAGKLYNIDKKCYFRSIL